MSASWRLPEMTTSAVLPACSIQQVREQRFAHILGVKPNEMASIVVTPEEHAKFTKLWRSRIGYDGDVKVDVTTVNATVEKVIQAAKEVYKDYPEIIKSLNLE